MTKIYHLLFSSVVGYPLTVIGGIMGKNMSDSFDAPCRTKNISREIPSVPWFRSGFIHCMVGGFLPFRYDSKAPRAEFYKTA